MPRLFGQIGWSLEPLSPPWGELPSIYEWVRLHGSKPLPDDFFVREKNKFGWIAGALDGVMGHHSWKDEGSPTHESEILLSLHSLLERAENKRLAKLYNLIASESFLPSFEFVTAELREALPSINQNHLLELGRYLTLRAAHREAVKFGLTVLGVVGNVEDLDTVRFLGQNEEFTLYAAVAIDRVATDREQALWDFARCVKNWGRIQVVERLKDTENPEIHAWMLREGFRNGVMNEYLACICARTGRLHKALKQPIVDDALLDGAADIIQALIAGGPAEDIDGYEHAVEACEAYVDHVWSRQSLSLRHFLAVTDLKWFLARPEGWQKRERFGWNATRRASLEALCNEIIARETWRIQIQQALSSADERTFYEADTAAARLSIDTWTIHFTRVKAAPLTSSSWFRLMQQTDEARISEVLSFAEAVLPFDKIETGPADELGLGPKFEPHNALDWILQDLRCFPGRGWRLIKAGLSSPSVRNRNMAINALASWNRHKWPADAADVLLRVHELEPVQNVKRRLQNLLAGSSGPAGGLA